MLFQSFSAIYFMFMDCKVKLSGFSNLFETAGERTVSSNSTCSHQTNPDSCLVATCLQSCSQAALLLFGDVSVNCINSVQQI